MVDRQKFYIKKFLILLLSVFLIGCGSTDDSDELGNNGVRNVPNRFGIIETHQEGGTLWYVIYDKKTGVEYLLMDAYYRQALTPLYDSDGEVILYDEVL